MLNPIKRIYKPSVPVRVVSLSVVIDRDPLPSALCEVIEYDNVTGMQQWNDSIYIQDFEDSVLTAPAPLYVASESTNYSTIEIVDPFAKVGNHSA